MTHAPTKGLMLRAVLNGVSPIVARVIAVPDHLDIHELHDVFLSLLGWTQDLGFIEPMPVTGLAASFSPIPEWHRRLSAT